MEIPNEKAGLPATVLECMEHDVSHSMRKAVAKYEVAVQSATGLLPRLVPASTPFLNEETKACQLRAPCSEGPFVECPSCLHTIPADQINGLTHPAGTPRKISKIWDVVNKESIASDGVGMDEDLSLIHI